MMKQLEAEVSIKILLLLHFFNHFFPVPLCKEDLIFITQVDQFGGERLCGANASRLLPVHSQFTKVRNHIISKGTSTNARVLPRVLKFHFPMHIYNS
jgi:hypothetical protein